MPTCFLRDQVSLNDEQVIEMVQLTLTLEAMMSYPVDIECAHAGGKLYLLVDIVHSTGCFVFLIFLTTVLSSEAIVNDGENLSYS